MLSKRWHFVGRLVCPTLTNGFGSTSFCSSTKRYYQRLIRLRSIALSFGFGSTSFCSSTKLYYQRLIRLRSNALSSSPANANIIRTNLFEELYWVTVVPTRFKGTSFLYIVRKRFLVLLIVIYSNSPLILTDIFIKQIFNLPKIIKKYEYSTSNIKRTKHLKLHKGSLKCI